MATGFHSMDFDTTWSRPSQQVSAGKMIALRTLTKASSMVLPWSIFPIQTDRLKTSQLRLVVIYFF